LPEVLSVFLRTPVYVAPCSVHKKSCSIGSGLCRMQYLNFRECPECENRRHTEGPCPQVLLRPSFLQESAGNVQMVAAVEAYAHRLGRQPQRVQGVERGSQKRGVVLLYSPVETH